jgi:hypothetical protein
VDGQQRLRKQDMWVSEPGTVAAADGDDEDAGSKEEREAVVAKFLEKHGFMVDDLVGDDPDIAVQRSQLKILILHVISIIQRCTTAVMFGFFHFRYISITQLGMLLSLHAFIIGYLLLVKPYASWILLLSDILAYLCELTILAVAVMLQGKPQYNQQQQMSHALIACYFFDVAAMVVPELLRYVAMGWAWVQARKQRQLLAAQGKAAASAAVSKHSSRRFPPAADSDGVVKVTKRSMGGKEGTAQAAAAAAAALKLSGSGASERPGS